MLRKISTTLFTVSFLLFIIRPALPQYIKYLLFPAVAVFGLLTIIEFIAAKRWQDINFRNYRVLLPLAFSVLAYFIAFGTTSYRSDMLVKDTFNLLVLTAFLVSTLIADFRIAELKQSFKQLKLLTVIFSTLFALAGIVKLVYMLLGHKWGFISVDGLGYPQGTSLSVDDNFFTLVCVIGILFATSYLFTRRKTRQGIVLQIALWVQLVNITLATSRRGLIIASAYFLLYLLFWLVSWFIKGDSFRNFRSNSTVFIGGFTIYLVILFYMLVGVSPLKRNEWLATSKLDKYEARLYLNWLTMSVESILSGETLYEDVEQQIWQTQFDSRYPYTGWASGNYHLVENLTGLGLKNVPHEAKGAMVGNWVNSSSSNGNAYYVSKLLGGKVDAGKRYLASVYCYVSPDFNGSWVRLSTYDKLKGIRHWYYNMNQKGTWQTLQNCFYADSGSYNVYLYLCKENDSTLTGLTGNVIFAYPTIQEVSPTPENPITWANNQFEPVANLAQFGKNGFPEETLALKPLKSQINYREKDSLWIYGAGLFRYTFQDSKRNIPSIWAYVSHDFNGDEVYLNAGGRVYGFIKSNYNLKRKGTWQKLYLSFSMLEGNSWVDFGFRKKDKFRNDSIRGFVLFAYPEQQFLRPNPNNPLTWAGTNFKRVSPLSGKGSEGIPPSSVGLRVDRESQARQYKDLVYTANTIIRTKLTSSMQRVKTSIYVYASPEFNGKNLRLGGSTKPMYGYSTSYYDLDRKGTWQKLTINNWGEAGNEYYSVTYFELPNANDFSSLTGYVVFAHPTYKILNFDPRNPESYTTGTYEREFPLIGDNAEIVPAGVVGARYTNRTEGRVWRDWFHSSTLYAGQNAQPGDSVFASVFCYVSPDFNGNDVRLEVRGKVQGQTVHRYNLNKKGEWVQLLVKGVVTEKSDIYGVYYFAQKGVTDFSGLTGHVTFAYPQLVVKPQRISLAERNLNINLASATGAILQANASLTDSLSGFSLAMANNRFAGPRIDRWRYAIFIFKTQYNRLQKLMGKGFDYTLLFAKKFHPDEPLREYDYPHNPFLSVLLYSGILGFILYLWFFGYSVYLYWLYRRDLYLFALTYLVAFFYSFFSANSPFEPALLGVLGAIPFIFHISVLGSAKANT